MIECHNISKRYKKLEALKNISIHIGKEESVSILGPSGCGKSTLLRIIAGLEVPDSGQVLRNGTLITDATSVLLPPERRHFGIIFQDFALFPHLNIFENIAYGLQGSKKSKKERVQELLELVNLESKAQEMPHQMSGGEQQRVAVARALAPKPQLILMDEPFSNLDHQLRVQLRREIKILLQHEKVSSVLVTHDQSEAISFSDRLLLMYQGTLIQQDIPQKVYHAPVNKWAASFMGEANFIELSWGHKLFISSHIRKDSKAHSLMVRPEDVQLMLPKKQSEDCEGRIRFIEFYGAQQMIEVELKPFSSSSKQIRVLETSNAKWDIGEVVQILLTNVQLFDVEGRSLQNA